MTKKQAIKYYENFFVTEYELNKELLEKYNSSFSEIEKDMGLVQGTIPRLTYDQLSVRIIRHIENLLPSDFSKFKPEHLDIIIMSIIITHAREHLQK